MKKELAKTTLSKEPTTIVKKNKKIKIKIKILLRYGGLA
jgi:hypothetical protein